MKNWELTGGAVCKHRGVVAVNYARYEDLASPLVDVLLLQQQQQKACTRITLSITPTPSCMFANLTNRIPGPGPRPRRIQKRMHGACFSATAEHLTVQLKSGWKNFAGKSDLRRTWWITVSTKQFFLICIKHFSDFGTIHMMQLTLLVLELRRFYICSFVCTFFLNSSKWITLRYRHNHPMGRVPSNFGDRGDQVYLVVPANFCN